MSQPSDDLESAIGQHRAGQLAEAYAGYVRILTRNPENLTARHYLGVLEMQRGNHLEASRQLDSVAKSQPHNPALQSDLGQALLMSGQLERAARAFEAVTALAGEHPDTRFNLALVRERQHRLEEAEQELQNALRLQPHHLKASLRLAHLKRRLGQDQQARARFEEILEHWPGNWEALLALAALAESDGDAEAAEALLREAIAQDGPPLPDAHIQLSRLLESQGRVESAIGIAVEATERCPGHDLAWRQLGQTLKRQGKLHEAVQAFAHAHKILRRPGSHYGMQRPEIRHATRAKLRHDIEQLAYLRAENVKVEGLDRLIIEHETLLAEIPQTLADGDVVGLPPADIVKAGGHYNRCMHRAEAPALTGGALSPGLDGGKITAEYFARGPGIAWIDGFLRPEALASLRRYLLESTIWHDAEHPGGYVGTYLHDGFDCPLVLQIAEELPALLPDIFGDRPLLQLWAYHYDSSMTGIGMHADFAAVNVNFWLTPDEAMLDPESGGMRIWDVEAPAHWRTEDFNTADPETKRQIDAFLAAEGARELVVPHRQNRMVIFNSDLFHRTDDIRFREGFENRRINVTMLYGRRELG
jgi:tetratricopeptide (TPR) repeat protein